MTVPPSAEKTPTSHKSFWAVCAGTFFEWYDFLCYAALIRHLGPLFFPSNDPTAATLGSLATFGIGMLARPLGALYFGSLGDRFGRRKVFITTLLLMGGATVAIGLLPTYQSIGILATILLVTLRCIQGFAVGGEIGGAVAYVFEYAPTSAKGLYGSLLPVMIPSAMLLASLQVTLLQDALSPESFLAWGWRIPFLLSGVLLAATILWRLALLESPAYIALKERMAASKAPVSDCLRNHKTRKHMAVVFFCASAAASITFFTGTIYAPLYLKTVIKVPEYIANPIYMMSMLLFFPSTVFFGYLSDRLGQRSIFLGGIMAAIVATPIAFVAMNTTQSQTTLLVCSGILMVIAGATNGPLVAILGKLFSIRTRYTAIGLAHNLSAGWIGGLAPLIMTYFTSATGHPLAGMAYLLAVLLISLVIAWCYIGKNPEGEDDDLPYPEPAPKD